MFVTGATGSFGTAFVRHALSVGASRVVCFSRDELKQSELRASLSDPRLRFFLGDIRDPERLTRAMKGSDVVVHAAALKRIETCEANPEEAIRTNVLGSLNVAKAAVDAGVEKAVMLSTDKAPNATTLYGASKFAAERLWCASNVYAAGTTTRLSAVRYGNVIGSRGSVLDLFQKQRDSLRPLTLTDERMTRFLMLISDSVKLVETALETMWGGEVFVPRISAGTLLDFARAVVEGPNGEPYGPGHVVTGLRATERLHETLISEDEVPRTYDAETVYVIEPESRPWTDGGNLELGWPKVPAGWSYRSDTCPRLSISELKRMIDAA